MHLEMLLMGLAVTASCVSVSAQPGASCPSWNRYVTDPMVVSDNQEHTSGNHQASGTFDADCEYTIQAGTHECNVSCSTTTTGDVFENGTVGGHWHGTGFDITQGDASSNGPQVSCGGQVQGAVRSCIALLPCDITVSVNGSVAGVGGGVSYSNTPLWKATTLTYTNTCAARGWVQLNKIPITPYPCNSVPYEVAPGNMLDYGYLYIWDNEYCQWDQDPASCLTQGNCGV